MTEHQYESNRGIIHYWMTENPNPANKTIVFLHGLTADHTLFDKQVAYFKEKFNLLVWDAPSHGKSRPYSGFTYPNAAEDLNRILEENDIAAAVMVGQSMGGYIIQSFGKKELCHLMGIGYAGFLADNRDMDIPCPTLLMVGERDKTGKVLPYCRAWSNKTGFPLHIIEHAAHNSNADNPDSVNKVIKAFLSGIGISV